MNSDLSDIATALTGSLPRDGQAGMTGQFKATDGSAAAPSITFTNDPTSGYYRVGTNQLGVTVGGSLVSIFGTTGVQNTAGIYVGVPVGVISPYAGSSAPTGWVFCNGASLLRASYTALFAVLGTTYGSADGTHFNVPDMRNFVPIGQDNMGSVGTRGLLTSTYFGADPAVIANTGGVQSTTLITGNLPAYTPSGSVGGTFSGSITGTAAWGQAMNGGATGNVGPSNNSGVGNASTFPVSGSCSGGISASFTGSAQGGTSTPFSRVQPGIIVPYIIFAGA